MSQDNRRASSINNSSSKHQYAFPKESRFLTHKKNTNTIHYDLPGYFGREKGANTGKGFYSSSKRFTTAKSNSPDRIDGPNQYDNKGNSFAQNMRYSFGVSRKDMNRIYIEEIMKKGRDAATPGPDRYTMSEGFGPS